MRFVTVKHPQFGTTTVPETRVPHLQEGWQVVDVDTAAAPPAPKAPAARKPARKRASRARKSTVAKKTAKPTPPTI